MHVWAANSMGACPVFHPCPHSPSESGQWGVRNITSVPRRCVILIWMSVCTCGRRKCVVRTEGEQADRGPRSQLVNRRPVGRPGDQDYCWHRRGKCLSSSAASSTIWLDCVKVTSPQSMAKASCECLTQCLPLSRADSCGLITSSSRSIPKQALKWTRRCHLFTRQNLIDLCRTVKFRNK